jgi:acetate---CoA ligase (ADP-forming)
LSLGEHDGLEASSAEVQRSGGRLRRPVECMLEARSVALVGASPRPGSLGERSLTELRRSPCRPLIHLVNPRYEEIGGWPCQASLDELGEPVDLVILAVGDARLEAELTRAASRGDRSAVIFASAYDPVSPGDPAATAAFRARLARIARAAGMALCGAGCMGFLNNSYGLRALGFPERDPLAPGGVTLVTHSGSAYSALLRTDRSFGFNLAVSSGQELVTTAADVVHYALDRPETRLVALLLETLRSPDALRSAFVRAAEREVPVVALTVGRSQRGSAMVAAHSGALAGAAGAWEALFDSYGVLAVEDLGEMCDTLELLSCPRRAHARLRSAPADGRGIAAVLDSGAERALLADVAAQVGVAFAGISAVTTKRLGDLIDPGLVAENPLDMWGQGNSTDEQVAGCLVALAQDDAVDAVVLAVDLATECAEDDSYRQAVVLAHQATTVPLCVLSHVPSALDRDAATRLRAAGIPVLEGTRSGLHALRHLIELASASPRPAPPPIDDARRRRWQLRLASGDPLEGAELVALLADYGIASPAAVSCTDLESALAAAASVGFPVALKTASAGISHKSEVGGVVLGLASPAALAAAYADVCSRLGPDVTISAMAPPGVELALGTVPDPLLGPLVVVGAGGTLVELLADRAVGLPPLDSVAACQMIDRLRIRRLLGGFRGSPPAHVDAVAAAVVAVSTIAFELGDLIAALEVNPLSCAPTGVLALDVLVELSRT